MEQGKQKSGGELFEDWYQREVKLNSVTGPIFLTALALIVFFAALIIGLSIRFL